MCPLHNILSNNYDYVTYCQVRSFIVILFQNIGLVALLDGSLAHKDHDDTLMSDMYAVSGPHLLEIDVI